MSTGTELTAVCKTVGEPTTNGDDALVDPATQQPQDIGNPGRYSSDLWYGIQLPGDRFGYLSVVWLAPEDRGGLGLSQC